MAQRPPHRKTYNEPGHAHELTFTCYHQIKFFQKERTCRWLTESIEVARNKLKFDLWAYVFMPEHVHLIVRPQNPEYSISTIIQKIKEPVGRKAIKYLKQENPDWLSRIETQENNRSRFHFWQKGGGYDRNITEPGTLMKMIDYIHQNPVRRELCEQAREWKWSSASWFDSDRQPVLAVDSIPVEWSS
jgi:putative transposase